jgi:ligand-binding sensor domain-containing protein/signal transduction histidine kinase
MKMIDKKLTITVLCLLLQVYSFAQKSNTAFRHLTTDDGLSQSYIYTILQDRQGFMWFATRDGLNRYDGNIIVVFKHNPDNPESLGDNFTFDLIEDKQGYLWIACNSGGINKFDPTTGRFTRYMHDPNNPNSISSNYVETLALDSHGCIWLGTSNGLNKFDPATQTFSCYRNETDGQFVGRITSITEDKHGDIWFVGNRGLFHLNPQTGQITRPPATIDRLSADYIYEDKAGSLWILAFTPSALVKYDPQTDRLTKYPLDDDAIGLASSNLLDDGQNGIWVPSSKGLYHFDKQTERFTHLFQHDETNAHSLNDNNIISIYKDKAGLLWLGTGNEGLNALNFQQEQFSYYRHNPGITNSLSSGKVNAIYEEPNGILWLGFWPRVLDRFDRNTGKITHYIHNPKNENTLGKGSDLNRIYKDSKGYLWLGGWEGGLDRFDERSGKFKHYRPDPDDPNSLISNHVISIYEDQSGYLWVGQSGGLSRFDRATEKFTNYRNNPDDPTSLGNVDVCNIYQDRSGTLWFGTWGGVLSRFDYATETFRNYTPDSRDPHKLSGGCIYAIHEDRTGTIWLGASDGLYRFNRENETFTRYTENKGLPSSTIVGILEDNAGRLWLSTKKGLSRFNPQTETFRNYDASDGLQDNDFSEVCYEKGRNGEMFFGSSKGFYAFFPENIKDNPYVPPVVLTDFRLFGKSVSVGNGSVLQKAINQTDELTLQYSQDMLSFEFAALGYAAPEKNRYAYKMEGFDKDWNYTDASRRLATYTNLDPGKYIFKVKASNNDGVWNETGTSIKITILPPWWLTWWFKLLVPLLIIGFSIGYYFFRVNALKKQKRILEHEVELKTREIQEKNFELQEHAEELNLLNATLIENQQRIEKQAEELNKSLAITKATLESIHNGILVVNDQGAVVKTNKRFAEMWNITEDIIASGDDKVLMESVLGQLKDVDGFVATVMELYRNPTAESLDLIDFKDGRTFERISKPMYIGSEPKGRVWSFTDITERLRSEAEIKQKSEQLLKLNAEKDKFFSIISHDLRSPFCGFIGLTELLSEELPNLTMAQVQDIAVGLCKSATNLYRLLENLLEWSRMQQGSIPFDPKVIQIRSIVDECIAMVMEPAKSKDIDLTYNIPDDLKVIADINMVQTVIRNLVSNAIKFTSKGGRISVSAKATGDKNCEISIQDTGIGMTSEMVNNLFRLDVKTNRKGTEGEPSSGLGLLLCKEFIEKQGGKIWVESQEGNGSEFKFTLPMGN